MKKIKLFIKTLISFFIATICMYIFIKNANINIEHIMGFIYNGWQYLTLACLLLVLTVYLRALRWKYLFHSTTTLQMSNLFQSQLIGYFINNVLPIRIGDIIRSYVIAKKSNQKTSYVIGTIIMERFLDTAMMSFFGFFVIWYYGSHYLGIQDSFLYGLFLLFLFMIILGYWFYKSIIRILLPIKIQEILYNMWKGFSDIQLTHKRGIIFYSILIWCIYALNVYLIQAIFPQIQLSIFDCLLILVASSFLQIIPIGFGALGVFHLGVQGVLHQLGIQDYNSFIIILHLYSLFIYTICGGYYFLKENTLYVKTIYNDLLNN